MDKWFAVFSIILLATGGYIGWTLLTTPMFFTTEEIVSFKYCEEKGHSATRFPLGLYNDYESEDYGRVICGDCYIEGCRWKEYNVTLTGYGGYLSKLNDVKGGKDE